MTENSTSQSNQTADADTESVDDTTDSPSTPEVTGSADDTSRNGKRKLVVPVVAGALAVASVAAAITTYSTLYRSDSAQSSDDNGTIVAAANEATVALLSYSPESLDKDFATANTHLTGNFLTYYKEFTSQVVKPAATDNGVKTKAEVVRSAVSIVDGDDAVVLAFVNQATTSKPKPEPELTSSSVRISLQRINGKWLVSSFDPV